MSRTVSAWQQHKDTHTVYLPFFKHPETHTQHEEMGGLKLCYVEQDSSHSLGTISAAISL